MNSVVDLFSGMAKGVNMFLVDDGAQVAFTGEIGRASWRERVVMAGVGG